MADVPPCSQRFLWPERFCEVDRHEAAWPENLRGEHAHGGEVRHEDSVYRFLPSSTTSRRPVRRGIHERCNRPICKPSSKAAWQEYLVDGRRRAHRLLS